jgi:hypothetical protein
MSMVATKSWECDSYLVLMLVLVLVIVIEA